MMDINVDSPQWFTFFDKKTKEVTGYIGIEIISEDQQMANKLHRPITIKFKKRKLYSSFRDNIESSYCRYAIKYNKAVRLLLFTLNMHALFH